jgi:type 1 glutamine amidotransferase
MCTLFWTLAPLLGAGELPVIPGEEKEMAEKDRIRVLVVTGGHDFEREPFFTLFQGYPDLTYQAVEQPQAADFFKPDAAAQYDVIVLYDMWQDLTDEAKAHFVALLQQGKGLVALHHSLGSYQGWEEYTQILGGRYHLQPYVKDGQEKPASTFQHGVRFTVHIADPDHPVTRGLTHFEIVDETYGLFEVLPQVKPLLTTEEPTSGPIIGWAHTYGRSRVVYLQLGHDHTAYEHPAYRRLVVQAIRWTARRAE